MKIINDIPLKNFDFWSGAEDYANELSSEEFDQIESILEEEYPDGINATDLNDIFWFDQDALNSWIGRSDEDDEDVSESRRSKNLRRISEGKINRIIKNSIRKVLK
jgi:hypothetical protein